jgi:methylenetetrahydrofolate dehydrogenase (NADP+) / methenyltetrahydrofolate cyclohydrolase
MTPVPPSILDGRLLAERRLPALRDRARRVRESRGTPPTLLLVAFADAAGRAPWVSRKVRAGREAGVDVHPLVLRADLDTEAAAAAVERATGELSPDGILLQLPFPPDLDLDALTDAMPAEADVDVMKPERVRAFMAGSLDRPPATVAAALALLDEGGVDLRGRQGVVIGEEAPFTSMLREALARRGVRVTVVPPDSGQLQRRLADAKLVVTAVNRSGAVRSSDLAPGSVVVDGGYFNPGGLGDVDLSDGVDHLEALAPVPGGVGPMTVSVLMEGVIASSEERMRRLSAPPASASPD